MHKQNKTNVFATSLLALMVLSTADAGEVKILAADFASNGDNRWPGNVTLQHDDTGWDHYADNWRVVDSAGKTLGERVLHHPHVDEQPFTRGLGGVLVPEGTTMVYIEAHDNVHGWTSKRLEVDLGKATVGRLKVEAE